MTPKKHEEGMFDLLIEDTVLREAGVVEPDEPTPYSHALYLKRLRGGMAEERRLCTCDPPRALMGHEPGCFVYRVMGRATWTPARMK